MEHSKSRRNFLKIVGLGSISLFTKSQAIGLPNNLVNSNTVNASNLAIDPVTAMAIAQFAYSAYQSMQGGAKDPLDAIVGILSAMNEKLDVIKGQLDFIYKEILRIPKETIYLMHLSQMVAVFEQLPVIYKQYNLVGKRKFIADKKKTINDHLTSIHGAFNNLKNSFDPVTVSYIVICSRVDFELSKLIDLEDRYVVPQMEAYLKYFKNALWLNPNNLPVQIDDYRKKIEIWRRDQSLFDLVNPTSNIRYVHHKFYMLKPLPFDSDMFNSTELQVIESLYNLGLLNAEDQKIKFNYEISTVPSKSNLTWAEHSRLWKEEQDSLKKEGYLRGTSAGFIDQNLGQPNTIEKRSKTIPVEYKDHFTMLLSILAAQQAAIDAVKFLNKIILLKK